MIVPAVVVFDLGKVLVDFDYGISSEKIARRSRFTLEEIRQLIDHSPLLYRFETGLLNGEGFYDEVRATSGYDGTFEEFRESFADIFSEIEPMTALQANLRAQGIPTWIFSNTNEIAASHIRKRFPFFAHFDGYVLSYQQGTMKPDEKIYAVVESLVGHAENEIVYLDDRAENIETARRRGWQTILHRTPEETLPALRRLGLPVGK